MTTRTEPRFDHVPHFDVITLAGERVHYGQIWQCRSLVLVIANPQDRGAAAVYTSQLNARRPEFDAAESTVVSTVDAVAGLSAPRVVVADRWGEILHIASPPGGDVAQFPSADEVLSWVRFAQIQCPECPP